MHNQAQSTPACKHAINHTKAYATCLIREFFLLFFFWQIGSCTIVHSSYPSVRLYSQASSRKPCAKILQVQHVAKAMTCNLRSVHAFCSAHDLAGRRTSAATLAVLALGLLAARRRRGCRGTASTSTATGLRTRSRTRATSVSTLRPSNFRFSCHSIVIARRSICHSIVISRRSICRRLRRVSKELRAQKKTELVIIGILKKLIHPVILLVRIQTPTFGWRSNCRLHMNHIMCRGLFRA